MPHVMTYNPETQIVETEISGIVVLDEIIAITTEALQLAKAHNTHLFCSNYHKADLHLSTLELHGIPQMINDTAVSLGVDVTKLKRALVVARDLADYSFYENVAVNRGQNARMFYEADEAKRWLLEH